MVCEKCGGNGVIAVSGACPRCNGTGEVIVYDDDGGEHMETCANCDFGLIFLEQTCSVCGGAGHI
ncbi:MAG TPA: hypothetical protein VFQ30_00010 [Ktedonobacteraceae bacterium]|nr:hypothetical protein [Ktedonobacteraceae bacterium]